MRFLLSRRWAIFFVTIVLAAWGAWALGQWQFHRLTETRATNHQTAHNLAAFPVPIDDLLKVGQPVASQEEWRRVTVTGTYDNAHSVVLKYQTRNSAAGADVVTPLITAGGAAVLVDRGWMATENSGYVRPRVPTATKGQVTVTGFVRVDATGGATQVAGLETRAISSATVAPYVPYKLYGGFLDIADQSPPATDFLQGTVLPDDTSDGPHFFYGLQWWFFGVLAVFGFFFLMYDEFKQRRVLSSAAAEDEQAPTTVA